MGTTQRPTTKLCRTRCQQSMEGSTSTGKGDGSQAGSGEVPEGTSTPGSSIISARKTPTQAGGRRTVGGPSTPIRSQTSIRNFLGKEGPHRQGKTLLRSPGGK